MAEDARGGQKPAGDQPEPMQAEFGTVAEWTLGAVRRLGPQYALPAACRGSGNPAALSWLARRLELGPGTRMLDSGAGAGGPAAFAAGQAGVRPVLAEPMAGACRAALALFGLPVIAADGARLPFAAGTFDAMWALGVLCTLHDKLAALREARRVLIPAGLLGLIVYVRQAAELPVQPEGNEFPDAGELAGLLRRAGFEAVAQRGLDSFPAPDSEWQRRADAVERDLRAAHAGQPSWEAAVRQEERMSTLLASGDVAGQVIVAMARPG